MALLRKETGDSMFSMKLRADCWKCIPAHTHTHTHTHTHKNTHLLPTQRSNCCDALMRATYCNVLQHTATHCNTLQHAATHYDTLQHNSTNTYLLYTQRSSDTLMRATYYNTLQHAATRCNTMQYTYLPPTRWSSCRDMLMRFGAPEGMANVMRCSVVWCVTIWYSVCYCVVVCCNEALTRFGGQLFSCKNHWRSNQCYVLHCGVLQCVAMLCSDL